MTEAIEVLGPEVIEYQVAGQTLAEFHADNSFFRGIRGPRGSGKSSCACVEIFRRACEQQPYQGVRQTRWAAIRNTTGELRTTTIKTWQQWLPERICPMRWSPPLTAHMRDFPIGDGTTIDMEVIFLALDTPKDIRHLLSLELTGAWVNEAREVPKIIVDELTASMGRFPKKSQGGPTWTGILADTNPPSIRHWWYLLAEREKPEGWRFFAQPGGLIRLPDGTYEVNPLAENVQNQPLGYRYWFNMLAAKDQEWINVRVLNKYGSTFEGKPVYEATWRDDMHVSPDPIGIYRGLPIFLGWDFGLTPACSVSQLTPNGRVNTLREYVSMDSGLRQFVTDVVRPGLLREFRGMPIVSRCGFEGRQRSQVDEVTCLAELNRCGIPTEAVPTQDLVVRRDVVNYWLTRMIEGRPAYQLDPSCTMLREGFNGGYHFARVGVLDTDKFRDKPDKNEYSHVHDSLQYGLYELSRRFTTPPGYGEGAVWAQTGGWEGAV